MTDAAGNTATKDVNVTFTTPAQLIASVSPAALVTSTLAGNQSATATVNAAGGIAPYTYSWSRLTGSRINVPAPQTATFTVSLGWSENLTESFQVTVTDNAGNQATAPLNVTFTTPPPAPTLTISPSSINQQRSGAGSISATATVSVTNGVAPFSYQWSYVSGDSYALTNAQSATVTFSASLSIGGAHLSGTYQVIVTDTLGRQGTQNIIVVFKSTCGSTACP